VEVYGSSYYVGILISRDQGAQRFLPSQLLPCGVATRTGVLMHGHMWWNGHADTHACIFLAVP
jgi:hypothetical protein